MVKSPVVSMVGEGHEEQADQRGLLRQQKKKKNTLNDTEMMDTCHNAFVQIRRLCNTKGEPEGKPWTLGDVSVGQSVAIDVLLW